MKSSQLLLTAAAVLGMTMSWAASAHNVLNSWEGKAGFSTPMTLSVNHGCHGSPVVGLRVQAPPGVTDAKASYDPNWTIEYKMRTLETPIEAHGREVTEVVDEIIWKDPIKAVPADGWYPFQFRFTIPDEPGKVIHVKNITVCEEGTDPYVDLPEVALDVSDPKFAEKAWAFMTATATPAPFLVVRTPDKAQYPWFWTPQQARGDQLTNQQSASAE